MYGGQQPISIATIQLYAVGTTGDGSSATPLLSPAVTTDANGGFTITGLYSCSPTTAEVYITTTENPCQLAIVFKPRGTQSYAEQVVRYDTVYGLASEGLVNGTGQNGYPAVALSLTSITFPLRSVGTTSIAQTVTLTNFGTGTAR